MAATDRPPHRDDHRRYALCEVCARHIEWNPITQSWSHENPGRIHHRPIANMKTYGPTRP